MTIKMFTSDGDNLVGSVKKVVPVVVSNVVVGSGLLVMALIKIINDICIT